MTSPSISQRKLRKLGGRAGAVVNRVGHLDPVLARAGSAVVASSEAFNGAYDAVVLYGSAQAAQMNQGRQALAHLSTRIRAWFGMLQHDIPGVGTELLDGRVDAPEHLLADADRIVELVQAKGDSLPYAEELVADLTAAAERANTQWTQARDAITKLYELRTIARERALELQQRLIAFRRAFRAVLGRTHPDYQLLRASRVSTEANEDEETVEVETEVEQTKATPTTLTPSNGRTTLQLGHPAE